jgi:uncharacterized protein involved in tolerance to divalent cations
MSSVPVLSFPTALKYTAFPTTDYVHKNHSYDTPQFVAVAATDVSPEYMKWAEKATK